MNVHRSLWLALPIAFLLPLGCNSAAETGESPEAVAAAPGAEAAAAPVAPVAQAGHHHGRHHRGPASMMLHAARGLDLTDAQRATIDGLSAQLHERAGERAAHQAMHAALVQGVRAGSIDLARVAPSQAASDQARQAHAAREAAALDGLYAALQPAQRQALVAGVRARQAEGAARWAAHREEGQAGQGHGQQRLAHLTAQLGLDAAQQQSVAGLLAQDRPAPAAMQARHQEMKARTEALLTAFAGTSFAAGNLDLAPPAEGKMGPAGHAQFLAQLVPILRADQRETLAASMEKQERQ
jgi:hypothetical protein